ncbi:MAG TPA: glycosyltransferase family 39 protein [Polyangiaceae bacterium]|nr:glycosyltransferase family 39 protein [Polyangiaceae bacterium]
MAEDAPKKKPQDPQEASTTKAVESAGAVASVSLFAWLPLALATAVPALFFLVLPPLTKSGLWDPYELNVADLARRVAINLYGASDLALQGADNSLPHLNDLGRPQLPFSSIALGFKLFGLHEWAGRLPLALWGLVGVLATYAFVARLFDRRTGVYAAVVLTTMPLYFVQARSMLGDVCAMSGLAMAFGGLAVAAFDPAPAGARVKWLLMAVVGLFAGFETRGALLGLGVPLLGVGVAWAIVRAASATPRDRIRDVLGVVSLAGGAAAAAMAMRSIAAEGKDMDLWVGAVLHTPSKYPTFDFYVASIGHSMAPWSAFLPFAFGRVLLAPTRAAEDSAAAERESLGRVAILSCAAVAFVAHATLAARTELIAFTGPAACAVVVAVAIRDLERGAHASIAVGVGTLLLAAVLHHDFHELPDKAYQAFGVTGATFPDGFKATALTLWWVVLGGFALCTLLTWVERDPDRTPFDPKEYGEVLKTLREAVDGLLAVVYFAAVAGTSLAGAIVLIGGKTHAHWLPQMSSTIRDVVLNAWWVVAFVPLGAVFGILFACDIWLWAFGKSKPLSSSSLTRGFEPFEEVIAQFGRREGHPDRDGYWLIGSGIVAVFMMPAIPVAAFAAWMSVGLKIYVAALLAIPSGVAFFLAMGILGDALRHRAPALAVGGAAVGFVLCFSYYPALANQLSPKEVFESYRHVCPGASLGLLGVGGRTAAYYAGGQPQTLSEPTGAFQWLTSGGGQRRCLALKAEELPKLNQLWRERAAEPKTNLPVVDARSSQILLAASDLGAEEKNANPLGAIVLTAPPHPQRRIDANMDDKLEVLGIDVVDDRGRPVEAVSPARTYHMRTYYRVLAPITSEWEAFIHIDGYHRRHNGDHKPMNGKYAMSLWLPGDLLVDDYDFKLEPNFTPGTYTIYFGLFVGDTRMKVKSGPNDNDNRINGGALRVQ